MNAGIQFVQVAGLDEISNGERLFFEIDNLQIVLFNIAGQFFAIGDICTHDNGPLGEGEINGFEVTCPRHGARFDVRNGQAVRLPAVNSTPSYPVRIVDGMIEIGIRIESR